MSAQTKDQRLFERFTARFPIRFQNTREDYGTTVFLRDASAEGLKLMTKDRVYVNDAVSLDIKLPDGHEPLLLNGKVVWARPLEANLFWDIGVQFHKISLMKLQRLFKFTDRGAEDQ